MESAIMLFICVLAMAGYALLTLHATRQQRQIRRLAAQLEVFCDTSIALGRSMDRLTTLRDDERVVQNVSSRRWVLREARTRLQEGQDLADVSHRLGLSRDEVGLLEVGLVR
ncbi:MAG: hypothetical protein AAF513_13070 [Pseudomonadota bacterium]